MFNMAYYLHGESPEVKEIGGKMMYAFLKGEGAVKLNVDDLDNPETEKLIQAFFIAAVQQGNDVKKCVYRNNKWIMAIFDRHKDQTCKQLYRHL